MIQDFINSNNLRNPNKHFIFYQSQSITIEEFNLNVNKISRYIKKHFTNNQYIGIQIENPILFFQTLIAINRYNITPVIYPNYNNISDYIDVTNIPISIDDKIAENAMVENYNITIPNNKLYNPSMIQVVLFTSGTSGKPKAIEISYQSIYNNALKWNRILDFSKNDLYINCLPLHHIGGLMIFFRTIIFNMTMKIINFKKLEESIEVNSIVSLVPTMINQMVKNNKINLLKNLKSVVVGGDNLNTKLKKECLESGAPFYISYGMTETCSGIAGYWLDKNNINEHRYIPHEDVSINVDNSLITIAADCLFSKYYGRKNNLRFFTTNDLGVINDDGSFSIIGRDNMFIVSGGENIDLSMIEGKIIKIKNVKNCHAVGVYDDRWGQKLIVYIVENKSDDKYNESYYLNMLAKKIPKFMLPKEINIVSNLNNIKI